MVHTLRDFLQMDDFLTMGLWAIKIVIVVGLLYELYSLSRDSLAETDRAPDVRRM